MRRSLLSLLVAAASLAGCSWSHVEARGGGAGALEPQSMAAADAGSGLLGGQPSGEPLELPGTGGHLELRAAGGYGLWGLGLALRAKWTAQLFELGPGLEGDLVLPVHELVLPFVRAGFMPVQVTWLLDGSERSATAGGSPHGELGLIVRIPDANDLALSLGAGLEYVLRPRGWPDTGMWTITLGVGAFSQHEPLRFVVPH